MEEVDPAAAAGCRDAISNGLLSTLDRHLWILAMAIATSCALSIKWTALATPGMIAVESFFGFFFLRRRPAPLGDLVKILAVAAVLYFCWFAIHFSLLPLSGDGDGFMRGEFQRVLKGNPSYDPLAEHPGVLTTFLQVNEEMLRANARIHVRHNWESYWWEWPLNLRGILYYSKDSGSGETSSVYLLGNPIVIWLVGFLMVVCAMSCVYYLRYKSSDASMQQRSLGERFFAPVGFCLWAYWLNLLPYILVARSAFIYHYMPALSYAEIMAALMVEQLVGKRHMRAATQLLLVAVVASWLYFCPWAYGLPLSSEAHARRRWYKRWD